MDIAEVLEYIRECDDPKVLGVITTAVGKQLQRPPDLPIFGAPARWSAGIETFSEEVEEYFDKLEEEVLAPLSQLDIQLPNSKEAIAAEDAYFDRST